jgi:site-specific DNA-methyltransferase (adenine-specific)
VATWKRKQPKAATTRCALCGNPITQPARGRPRRYCPRGCRQRAYRLRKDSSQKRRLVKLVEGDALELLRSLPDESIDLIVTDPPYWFERGTNYHRTWFEMLNDSAWPPIFAEFHRVLPADAHVYVFCDERTKPLFDQAAEAAGFKRGTTLVWDKGSIGLGGCWRPQIEYIAFYRKGARTGNYRDRANILRAPRVRGGYPTEKPIPILKRLIEQSSSPGELVFDPFCGSGDVGRAARELRRQALLCDTAPEFAARRLRITTAPLNPANALRNATTTP